MMSIKAVELNGAMSKHSHGENKMTLKSFSLVVVCFALTASAFGQEATELDFLCFDGFNGRTNLNWQPVRPDPGRIALSKKPGCLTITAQQGTIHRDLPPTARNLFVMDNPLDPNTDFMMTTRLVGFQPTEPYQQAGLLLYNDDDNYVKWILQFNWREGNGVALSFLRETNAISTITPVTAPVNTNDLWLRLIKRGNLCEYSSSVDGKTYQTHGEGIWDSVGPKKMGLVAKTGGSNAGTHDIDVNFDFFELRPPVSDKSAAK